MARIPTEMFHEVGSIIAVCCISIPVWYGMYRLHKGVGIIIMIALGLFSLGIETIALYTGFPYSYFEYTSGFGYQLFGTTPWTVFIAWSPLVVGAYAFSQTFTNTPWKQWLGYILLLVCCDLVLDPGAVARGLWSYTNGGLWYGVPLTNFLGWVFSGTLAYGIIKLMQPRQRSITYTVWLILPIIASLALWSGVNIGYGIIIPAIIGLVITSILISHTFKKLSHM
jgi:putative membrane protein